MRFERERGLAGARHGSRRPRVGALILGLALEAAYLCLPALAQVIELTVDPAMVRGSADAPVTIVEFADYQ